MQALYFSYTYTKGIHTFSDFSHLPTKRKVGAHAEVRKHDVEGRSKKRSLRYKAKPLPFAGVTALTT